GAASDVLLHRGIAGGQLDQSPAGDIRRAPNGTSSIVALGRRSVPSGEAGDASVSPDWAGVVAAMTPADWFASTQRVLSLSNAELVDTVHAVAGGGRGRKAGRAQAMVAAAPGGAGGVARGRAGTGTDRARPGGRGDA